MAKPLNTTLPEAITPGSTTGLASNSETVHAFVNAASRDTGRRNVASLLINGWTAATVQLRRADDRCYLYIAGLNGSAATNSRFMEVPAGFQPPIVIETQMQRNSSGSNVQGITVSLSGGFTIPTGTVLGSVAREISWPTEAAFPTSLPGTEV